MEKMKFQIVEKFALTTKSCDENQLVNGLRGERMKSMVQQIRDSLARGDNDKADAIKKTLPAILVSGTFEGGRTADKLVSYSHVVCLDLDKVDPSIINELKEAACNCEYTFIAFISPSGRGLKILVKVSTGSNYHRDAYRQVVKFYSSLLKVHFDEKTSDINRLTFMSYDPEPYHYPDSTVFPIVTPIVVSAEVPNAVLHTVSDDRYRLLYEKAYSYALKKEKNEEGSRNNFLFLVCSNCNRYGLPKDELFKHLSWCELAESEIQQTVNSAYKRTDQFGTWKPKEESIKQSPRTYDERPTYTDIAGDTPFIPTEVKKRLPVFIQEVISAYSDSRQSDMALTTLLSLLSSFMDRTRSVYQSSVIYPSLSSMVTAPSGSGKSITGIVQRMFIPLHKSLTHEPQHPHGLFLPDNTSTTALIKYLKDNDSMGVLFSTDMGFLGHALKRDKAGLQAILRASHSGEILTYGRNAKRETIMVANPKLTACLCATPQEFQHLFTSTEDGLISRFIHYCFVPDTRWNDVSQVALTDYKQMLSHTAQRILNLYGYTKNRSFEFSLNEEQLLAMNDWLSEQSKIASTSDNWTAINPIIRRMGHVCFKLSMVMATVRAWEVNYEGQELSINADDFDVVMKLLTVYFKHAASIVNYVVAETGQNLDLQLESFYAALPDASFKRKDAIEVVKQKGMQVSDRTVDNWLKRLTEQGLLISGYNNYTKVKKPIEQSQQAA